MPLDSLIPWSVPVLDGRRYHVSLSSTATRMQRGPNDTTTDVDMNVGPPIPAAPPIERPRVGRPHRGDRAKVKAARRAKRTAR